MRREIVFDTETTGTDPAGGDRIVEIGCVELINHVPSGRTHHVYVNPRRPMSAGAFEVHGLSDEFLGDKPPFEAVAADLHGFFGDARLVAHNATFDVGFLNAEFTRSGHPILALDRIVDTLTLARRRHPGSPASLDALCARYGIDNSRRTKHGALLDAELLAEVYLELLGGRQAEFGLVLAPSMPIMVGGTVPLPGRRVPPPRPPLDPESLAAHAAFVATLGGGSPIWQDYVPAEAARP